MTTFYNFAFKIETSWAKKDVKLSLEAWNVNDVIVDVWYIFSQINKNKNMKDIYIYKKTILNVQNLQ